MELARRLAGFFAIATQDERLSTSHICIYLALCTLHAASGLDNPFSITRRQVMTGCKILGNATYHKCMKDLHQYGYITYVPSYHPVLGSLVTLNEFSFLLNQ